MVKVEHREEAVVRAQADDELERGEGPGEPERDEG